MISRCVDILTTLEPQPRVPEWILAPYRPVLPKSSIEDLPKFNDTLNQMHDVIMKAMGLPPDIFKGT